MHKVLADLNFGFWYWMRCTLRANDAKVRFYNKVKYFKMKIRSYFIVVKMKRERKRKEQPGLQLPKYLGEYFRPPTTFTYLGNLSQSRNLPFWLVILITGYKRICHNMFSKSEIRWELNAHIKKDVGAVK